MARGALTLTKEYRSTLEKRVAAQLVAAGVGFDYEGLVLRFTIPAFLAKYNPDFPCHGSNIVIEAKGRFGHMGSGGAEVRQRLVLVKEQHPEYDFRILFDKRAADIPIFKGSKTTQGKWATDHGFKWASGTVPASWIAEIKATKQPGDTNVADGTVASKPRKRS